MCIDTFLTKAMAKTMLISTSIEGFHGDVIKITKAILRCIVRGLLLNCTYLITATTINTKLYLNA